MVLLGAAGFARLPFSSSPVPCEGRRMGRLHHGKVGATHRDHPRNGRRHRSVKLVKRGPRPAMLVVGGWRLLGGILSMQAGCGGLMEGGLSGSEPVSESSRRQQGTFFEGCSQGGSGRELHPCCPMRIKKDLTVQLCRQDAALSILAPVGVAYTRGWRPLWRHRASHKHRHIHGHVQE